MVKVCFKCGEEKDLDLFYVHKQMADGHLNKCKECTKKDSTGNRWNHIERVRGYDRSRGRRQGYSYTKEYRALNPEKYKAHGILNRAVRDGSIKKEPCEGCGSTERLEAHHHDYSKPLDVVWLCSAHHSQLHRDLKQLEVVNGEGA